MHYETIVGIPHPFTYLITKLHAFSDRCADERKDNARHHAIDVFRIVSMMTEDEYNTVKAQVVRFSDDAILQTAQQIVREHFSGREALGLIRIREHDTQLSREWEQDVSSSGEDVIDDFIGVLWELLDVVRTA